MIVTLSTTGWTDEHIKSAYQCSIAVLNQNLITFNDISVTDRPGFVDIEVVNPSVDPTSILTQVNLLARYNAWVNEISVERANYEAELAAITTAAANNTWLDKPVADIIAANNTLQTKISTAATAADYRSCMQDLRGAIFELLKELYRKKVIGK